ncbi:MAG TPA: ribosome maturation factor RimM [Dysgonamonadaceae bacterium]|nr:ribosome maturation factor RimM [Dysgonamonadaceae bacterium]
MIDEKKLFEIGKILKPHGVKGEVTVFFNKAEFADTDHNYYFLSLDGMYVPFFVEEFLYNSDVTARIKFKGIDSIEEASNFSNTIVLIPDKLVQGVVQDEELDLEWEHLIGYTVFDENFTVIGTIDNIDSSTINTLFVVVSSDEEILIPATPDFIVKVDSDKKQLYLQLPEGLLGDSIDE